LLVLVLLQLLLLSLLLLLLLLVVLLMLLLMAFASRFLDIQQTLSLFQLRCHSFPDSLYRQLTWVTAAN
jgi:hypothetical protein